MAKGGMGARLAALASAATAAALLALAPAQADDSSRLIRVDHYVKTRSTTQAMAGRDAEIYIHEVVMPGVALRGAPAAGRVVVFVHGAGTPAEVAFDPPFKDYSWMGYLAKAGFDTFSIDMTGYGRSSRPAAMEDACNVPRAQQGQFIGSVLGAPCNPSFPRALTTMDSDWNDIDAAVDHIRAIRHVDKVAIVGWSQGGPRSAGYAMKHPEKVSRLVVLAPAYNRTMPTAAPNPLPASDGPLTVQSRTDFDANWERQVGCAGQYEPETADAVWASMLDSDPVGATWGPGVRRAPQVPSWGFNQTTVAKMQTPFLMITGQHDKQVPPERVRDLFADLGSKEKVIVDLACSSHNAMWEKNHLLLFRASLEWLRDGKVNGQGEGMLRLGY